MKSLVRYKKIHLSLQFFAIIFLFFLFPFISYAQPANDNCASPTTLTSATTCVNTAGTLFRATATAGIAAYCGNALSADVWYQFTAQTAYPVITLSSVGASFSAAGVRIQIFTNSCSPFTSLGCVAGTTFDVRTVIGGAGLTVGNVYKVRIFSNASSGFSSGTWTFNICITDPAAGRFDYSKSYVNITKGLNGGTVNPGDTLEYRATFVVFSNAGDSLAFYDTLKGGKGLKFLSGSLALRTNEGKVYKSFTDAFDADAGWRNTGADTTIQINFGTGASNVARGKLRNTSKPSFYGSTCIIMATYRVVVYASYNTKVNFGGGAFTFRDSATGVLTKVNFITDSIVVYQSPGLCPNAVSVSNAIGVETNGTFGTPSTGAPLARNRGTSSYVPGYMYSPFNSSGGPQDYYYAIPNNTSANFTILQNWAKPDGSSPSHRVFSLWDIIGDHTGASNTNKGNPPCDTTKPVSASNPCGYMLVINSAYKTDTAFQYTVTNLCPNTYYEISAWLRNICYKCGCDSNGVGASGGGYIPFAAGDSSGVQPNLAFDVNGSDYYTTGNLKYWGVGPTTSDTSNKWVKKGFTYLTGSSQTSFTLTIRNNAPGGGGNDWAIDDIAVATCLPNMKYSPSVNPTVCQNNPITVYDTVQCYFNNYTYYKWQRSTDGGATWTDETGPLGPASPVWNGTAWQYIVSYTIPPGQTTLANNGDRYRLVVATTLSNLSDKNCEVTDGFSIITLNVIDCGPPLAVNILSFSGKIAGNKAVLSWVTSKENEPLQFNIEKSIDGVNFSVIGSISSYQRYGDENNFYSFTDPNVAGKVWYRIMVVNADQKKKYSPVILLNNGAKTFGISNIINPFDNELNFELYSDVPAKMEASIIDMFGRTVKKLSLFVYEGANSVTFSNTNVLSTGIYILKVEVNGTAIQKRIMKTSLK